MRYVPRSAAPDPHASRACLPPVDWAAVRYWTSDDPADRETARRYCLACAARPACYERSVKVLPQYDDCIYAALDGKERRQLRSAACG